MDNKTENKVENKTPVAPVAKTEAPVDNAFLALLDIDADQKIQEEFIKHIITSKVSGFRPIETEDGIKAVQIQCKSVDKETGNLIDFTFKLNSDEQIKDEDITKYIGKTVQVKDMNRYTSIERDTQNREIARTFAYGGELTNVKVVSDIEEAYEVNSYVEVELTSVANVMKKDKPTGNVKLISIKEEGTESRTFECTLKNDELKVDLDRKQFAGLVGKKIRINGIKENRFAGKLTYSTVKAFELVK